MKNIKEYLDYLYKFERLRMKYDLRNIKKILKTLGNPEKELKCIHIAGTNGKGAVASFTASILQEHGLKTGLFTSPHILKFNERIRVNGKQINNAYIKNFLSNNLKLFQKIRPSFFEVCTALAFSYFRDKNVDAAVIECGLGGRLDSTNIITPLVSVITQIAMDHEKYLGNSLLKIAKEKLGIVKKNVPVVVSDNNLSLKKLFYKSIDKLMLIYLEDYLSNPLLISPRQGEIQWGSLLKYKKTDYINSNFQIRNAQAALTASEIFLKRTKKHKPDRFKKPVGFNVTKAVKGLRNLIKNTSYHCRLETIKKAGYDFIFDVAHNPAAVKNTYENLKDTKINAVVFGMMEDKDYISALPYIMKLSDTIIFTRPSYHRSLEPEILLKEALKYKKPKKLFITLTVQDAIKKVYIIKGRKVLFCGSFFLVSDALKVLKLQKYIN
jgi:dihydrofolate synthase/folylpolyglutamate synthase